MGLHHDLLEYPYPYPTSPEAEVKPGKVRLPSAQRAQYLIDVSELTS